ncbi:peroxiredoxin family protein [Acidobacteria bacterium AH-259-D05]|nr:peroxiredoxin family protein [Acidobacteria bacterium AH-259-D05]
MRGLRLPFALVLCLLLATFFSTLVFSDEFDDLEIGEMAPDFTLRDLAEKEYALSDLEGEIVVIQFGSSTTAPFVEQIKPMNELIKKYRRKGVTFVTVYTVEQEFNWQADDYFSKYERAKGLRFQFGVQSGQRMSAKILVDDLDETVYKAYGSVPAGVFIVDKDGTLALKARVVKTSDIERALGKMM